MYKRREHILAAVTAIFLAMCLCLLGCGGSGSGGNGSPQMSSSMAAPPQGTAEPEESYDYEYGKETSQIVINGSDGEAGGAPQFDLPDTRKVIRHANMELETKEFDPALSGILQAVANAGGYIESQDHKVTFHLNGKTVAARDTLKGLEEKLKGQPFARCNNCYLVNLAYVEAVKENCVTVAGERLQISRPKRKGFMEALAAYVGRG